MSSGPIWFIRLQGDLQGALPCMSLSATGQVLHKGTSRLRDLPKDVTVWGVLPPTDFTLLSVNWPAGDRKKAWDALPFLVESHLIGAPEDSWVHPLLDGSAGSTPATGQPVRVAVTDKARIHAVAQALTAHGVRLRGLTSDALGLQPEQGLTTVHASQEGAWVYPPEHPPFHMRHADDAAAHRLAWVHADKGWVCVAEAANPWAQLRTPAGTAPSMRSPVPEGQTLLAAVRAGLSLVPNAALSGVRSSDAGSKAWRTLALGAAGLVALWTVGLNAYAWKWNRHADAVDAAVRTAFERALPNTPMIADPLLLLKRQMAQGQTAGQPAPSDFTPLFEAAARALEPALGSQAVTAVDYAAGVLKLHLKRDPSADQKRTLEAALAQSQLKGQWSVEKSGQMQAQNASQSMTQQAGQSGEKAHPVLTIGPLRTGGGT